MMFAPICSPEPLHGFCEPCGGFNLPGHHLLHWAECVPSLASGLMWFGYVLYLPGSCGWVRAHPLDVALEPLGELETRVEGSASVLAPVS
jgi:hypothetical protein